MDITIEQHDDRARPIGIEREGVVCSRQRRAHITKRARRVREHEHAVVKALLHRRLVVRGLPEPARNLRLDDVVLVGRYRQRGKDADDGHDDHHFDQRKTPPQPLQQAGGVR
ncbi:hypothetical protein D3C72_868280 [compost metagenome]